MQYRCSTCGQVHDDLPDIGADKPDPWFSVPEKERRRRVRLTSDTCIIDGEQFYIRGVLKLPIHEQSQPFGFGVWVSQKKENFYTYRKYPDTSEIGPFFGWLCTRIRYYKDDTSMLKTMAHFHDGTLRPTIELEPTDHPLAIDQRNGITLAKAWEIVHYYGPSNKR